LGPLNIGHRHILPIYPVLIVMISSLVPWAVRQRIFVKGGLAVMAGWLFVSSVGTFPHYLAYFNELVGGPENGYKYLVDSNLDWGQDLKGLKRYLERHGIHESGSATSGQPVRHITESYTITYRAIGSFARTRKGSQPPMSRSA
jgi:hypothetical protein